MYSTVIERLRDRRDGAGESGADAGFTLIELMVVLLIMAILLAIAIPTFLGVSSSANDRAAQSNLNTALTNAKSYYDSNAQSFPAASAFTAAISSQEPSISWVASPAYSTGSDVVSVYVDTTSNANAVFAALSTTGTCWYLVDNESAIATTDADTVLTGVPAAEQAAGTFYGGQKNMTKTTCNAASVTGTNVKWQTTGTQGFPSV
jgi:type IV pilus assembly protein PilA